MTRMLDLIGMDDEIMRMDGNVKIQILGFGMRFTNPNVMLAFPPNSLFSDKPAMAVVHNK